MAKLGRSSLRFCRGKPRTRGSIARRGSKLRKLGVSIRAELCKFHFKAVHLKARSLKGGCSVHSNRDRVLNWRAYTTWASKNPLFAKCRGAGTGVKRRIIRSLMCDYHALSWRTCGRTTRAKRNEIIIRASSSFVACCSGWLGYVIGYSR